MKRYLKIFLHRGLIFGGFGPVILGIVYATLERTTEDFTLSGTEVLIAIVSIYLLAFLQAGASVFNQIDHWSVPKSMLCHGVTLYAAYLGCYLVNRWIPFYPQILLIFTGIFLGLYLLVWLMVYTSVKLISRKLNERI